MHHNFSTYTAALQKNNPISKTSPIFTSHPIYYRSVIISFSTNVHPHNNNKIPPSQKHKTQHNSRSIIINTTIELTHPIEEGWGELLEDHTKENNI